MANPYFRFKQFTVYHDRCAMKVTTDGCLFGAWLAQQLSFTRSKNVLDIGAGSGLLSLMVAQQTEAIIDAVEIEPNAALQATGNIFASPWKSKISVHQQNILDFNGGPYNAIFSNPPFYEAELKSNTHAKNIAHHSEGLRLEGLLNKTEGLLAVDGDLFLMLPYKRLLIVNKLLAAGNWTLHQQITVHPSPAHAPFRLLMHVSKKKKSDPVFETLLIKESDNQYSTSFSRLLKDFYLYL